MRFEKNGKTCIIIPGVAMVITFDLTIVLAREYAARTPSVLACYWSAHLFAENACRWRRRNAS